MSQMNKDVATQQLREGIWQAFQVDLLLPADTLSVCTEHCRCLCKFRLQQQVSV